MRRAVLAASIVLLALGVDGSAEYTAAMPHSSPVAALTGGRMQPVRYDCRCARAFAPRHYWQWDSRPIWDDPRTVLRPNFWGSPEPHLVPADIWGCKWHLPWGHPSAASGRWRRRLCPARE